MNVGNTESDDDSNKDLILDAKCDWLMAAEI